MSTFEREQFTTVWGLPGFHNFQNPLHDPVHSLGKDLHGRFLPEIPYQLINKYCCNPTEDIVFDPFGGTGTVMVEAYRLGYKCTSIDIDDRMIACHHDKMKALTGSDNVPKGYAIIQQSSVNLNISNDTFAVLITSPPYPFAIKFNPKQPEDLSNVKDYDNYLKDYTQFLKEFIRVMRPGGYICQVLSDVVDDTTKIPHPFIADITCIMSQLEQEYVRTITFPFVREVMRAQGSDGQKKRNDTLGVVSDNILNKGWYIFADEKIVIFRKPGGSRPIPRFTASKGRGEQFTFDELFLLWTSKIDNVNRKRIITQMLPTRGEVSLMLQVRRMKAKGWLDDIKLMYQAFNIEFSEEQFNAKLAKTREQIKQYCPN
jgi:hypothetical protein